MSMTKTKDHKEILSHLTGFEQGLLLRDQVDDILDQLKHLVMGHPKLTPFDGYRIGLISSQLVWYHRQLRTLYQSNTNQLGSDESIEAFIKISMMIQDLPDVFTHELGQPPLQQHEYPLWAQQYGRRVFFKEQFLDKIGRVRVKQGQTGTIASTKVSCDGTVSVKIKGKIITINAIPLVNLSPSKL